MLHGGGGHRSVFVSLYCRALNIDGFNDVSKAEVDWLIGEVVAKVTSANVLENTLMLFTGDNGPWLMQGKRDTTAAHRSIIHLCSREH